ncbi:MAG: hypothetical protein HYT03_00390 [Candidatus Harrisonbacteria bacterium]|nr:hypothetical protein [Candidatus Harrisonbacteria bacterium]
MNIYKIGVVGGGAMGSGIATLAIRKGGIPVVIKEANSELASAAKSRVLQNFDSLYKKNKIFDQQLEKFTSLLTVTDVWGEDFKDVDLLIEAVPEKMNLKKQIFAAASLWLPPQAILASNTSALSISEMGEQLTPQRHQRVLGLHFFNPPTRMKLVEVVATRETSEATLAEATDFVESALQRLPVRVKECPGFLVNRLLMPYLNEAVDSILETSVKPEEIDKAAMEFGWPVGPFILMDSLGLDICEDVAETLRRGYGDRVKLSPLLQKLVNLGRLGGKTGAGFYGGDETILEIIEKHFPWSRCRESSAKEVFNLMMIGLVKEAELALEEGIASAADIENACVWGIGFPKVPHEGPLHWGQSNNYTKKKIFQDEIV